MGTLDGKVAVITGGTRGLGLAIAEAFIEEGAVVVVASRSQGSVDRARTRLASAGGVAQGMALDVSSPAQVRALGDLAASLGPIDIWVNNAGLSAPYGPTLEVSPEAFHEVVNTNIMGVYNGSREAFRHFQPRRRGKLINVIGRGARGPVPFQNAYAASKAWVRSFTLALAKETRGSGVGVFAFQPGMLRTDMLLAPMAIEGHERRLDAMETIVRMWARPPAVAARKAVWLASSATDGMTGKTISVSGPTAMLGGALREGWRRLMRRPLEHIEIQVEVEPSISPDFEGDYQ
jgi:glucose 1-dehydrogenase